MHTTTPPSSPDRHAGVDRDLRSALEGMLRSARGMVTFTERALAAINAAGSRDDGLPSRRLDKGDEAL